MNYESELPTQDVLDFLFRQGFTQVEDWKFEHDGILYDLSAANLLALDYIVKNKLFVVKIEE